MTPVVTAVQLQRLRARLALIRLALLYAALCILLTEAGLLLRTARELGLGLDSPLPPPSSPAMQIPFVGVNVVLEQVDAAERRQALQRLQASGFGWVRQRLDWGQLEPQPGQFDWQRSDSILRDIEGSGLTAVVVLDGSPAWARLPRDRPPPAPGAGTDAGAQDNSFAPPADPADFARFAGAFARRYGHQVRFYQIWDEPNIAPHWGNRHIDPTGYARLLAAASAAIRQADPDAVILLAALAPTVDRGHTAIDEPYFLQRLYATGAASDFDAVAVQPFGFGHAPADHRQRAHVLNFQRIALVRRVMQAAGDGATPIWAVRYGWNTHYNSPWGTVRPQDQPRFAVEAFAVARSHWPWLATMAWAIDRPAAPPHDPLWGFALVRPDGTVTPLLEALREAIDGAQFPAYSSQPSIHDVRLLRRGVLVLAAIALALWRSVRAMALLPWRAWLDGYARLPLAYRLLGWSLLLSVYYFATWLPLIGLCWLLATFWMAAWPQSGLWLAAALLPFHYRHKEIHLVDGVWTVAPAHAALLCLLLAMGIRAMFFPRSPASLPLAGDEESSSPSRRSSLRPSDLLTLAWPAISLAAAANVWHRSAYGSGLWNLVLMPLLLYVAVRRLAVTPRRQHHLALALLVGAALTAAIGLVDWLRGGGTEIDGIRRLVGLTFSPNQTALYLERASFLAVALAGAARTGRGRGALLGACALLLLALALTASRGAWLLGLPVGGGVFVWLLWRHRGGRRLSLPALPAAVGSVLVGALLIWSAVELGLGTRLLNSASVQQRIYVWQGALAMVRDFPWVGVGPGEFFWRYPAYMLPQAAHEPNLLHPHNLWLELATGWGAAGILWLLGLLFTLWRWAGAIRRCRREERRLYAGLLAGTVAGLAHAQVDTFTALPELAAWNWLALGILGNGAFEKRRGHDLITPPSLSE